jgi:outer membrane protein
MRIIKQLLIVTFLTLSLTASLSAAESGKWVEQFLRRYQPLTAPANPDDNTPGSEIAEMLQTGTVPIAMSDLINLMLDKNLDIQSNRFSPRSSYFSSLVFYRALQPSIRFSGTLTKNSSQNNSQLNGTATVTRQTRINTTTSFTQALSTGTSLSVDLTMNRTYSNSNLSTYNPSYSSTLTYSLGQHLLRDRGRLPTTRQIMSAQNNQKISEINFEIQLTNLLVQAQKAYWDLVFAGEDLKVKQRSLELAQQTLNENELKVQIGTLAPIDVIQTKSDVATRRDAMVTSTFSVTTAEDQIKKLVSADKDPSMFLLKFTPREQPKRPESVAVPSLEDAVRIALENRPEMRSAALDLKNRDIDEKYTANQKLPVLDLTTSYNQNGVGGTYTPRSGIGGVAGTPVPGGIGDAFHQLFGYHYSGYSMNFVFNMPLSNRAAVADHDRAVTERQLSEAKMKATAQSIMLEVRNALTQVEQNRARIETAQTALDLERQKLDAEQTKFNLGTSTLRFVLEEQRNLAQAETSELQSRVNFTKSLIDLDKAMGMTLRNNSIEVDKALQSSAMGNYKPAGATTASTSQN